MIRTIAIRRDVTSATTRLFVVTLVATAVTLLALSAQPASAQATAAKVSAMSATAHMFDITTFKKPSDAALKKSLTPLQYSVTQREDTEFPYRNEYWNNHADSHEGRPFVVRRAHRSAFQACGLASGPSL